MFFHGVCMAMDSKNPKRWRFEFSRSGRTSKGKQWEDEQKSKKRKVDEYSRPLLIYCLMFSRVVDIWEVWENLEEKCFFVFARGVTYGQEVWGSIRFGENMVGIESLGRWVVWSCLKLLRMYRQEQGFSMVCAWQWTAKIQNCEDLSLPGVGEHQRASNGRICKRAKREK